MSIDVFKGDLNFIIVSYYFFVSQNVFCIFRLVGECVKCNHIKKWQEYIYWVSDYCLTLNQHFQLCHGENKLHSMKWWWCPLYSRPACRVGFLLLLVQWTTVCGYTCLFNHTHYPDSEPTSLCSYPLNAVCLAEKQKKTSL